MCCRLDKQHLPGFRQKIKDKNEQRKGREGKSSGGGVAHLSYLPRAGGTLRPTRPLPPFLVFTLTFFPFLFVWQ